jgi:hypothetical protein
MIKKYDDGKLTPYIHSLNVGDKLAFKGPIKKWAYKSRSHKELPYTLCLSFARLAPMNSFLIPHSSFLFGIGMQKE